MINTRDPTGETSERWASGDSWFQIPNLASSGLFLLPVPQSQEAARTSSARWGTLPWGGLADDSPHLRTSENDVFWYVTSSLQCFSFIDPGRKTQEWNLLLPTLSRSFQSPASLLRQQASLISKQHTFHETDLRKQQTQEWASRSQRRKYQHTSFF